MILNQKLGIRTRFIIRGFKMNYFFVFSVLFAVINLLTNNSIRETERRYFLLKYLFLCDELSVFLSKFKVSRVF